MANPAKAYLATQVETTTQGELLLMLYEAAIKFLKRAKIEIDNKDFAKKGIYISKAMAIIHELSESLNKEKGGEITPKLGQLYLFCTTQLVKANIRLDNRMVDDVIRILDGLRSAFAQIVPAHDNRAASGDVMTKSTPVAPLAPPIMPTPMTNQARPKAAAPKAEPPVPTGKAATAETEPVDPNSGSPIRSAASAAKFRAANAYTNANR